MSDVGWFGPLPLAMVEDEPVLRRVLENILRNAAKRYGAVYLGPLVFEIRDEIAELKNELNGFVVLFASAAVLDRMCLVHEVETDIVLDSDGAPKQQCPECERTGVEP